MCSDVHVLPACATVILCRPPAPIAMYAVSKTALLGLTKGLAAELGPEGITVNCVAPGIVPTKFSAALVADPELVSGTGCQAQLLWLRWTHI